MPQYLVTGGLGFIGSHLAHLLLADPQATVTVVDNLQGQVLSPGAVIDQIAADRPGKLIVRRESVAEFSSDEPFTAIFHLASVVGPTAVLKYSGHIVESIVRDSYAVVRRAQHNGARLVNVSTSEVYGGGDKGHCREDSPRVIHGPASARQEYAAGKLACEVAIANLCRDGKLDAVTIRPFNVAGVRQLGLGGFALPRFVGQALLGMPLTVFGDGAQLRAFTDVRDVAAGIILAAMRGERGAFYNVGNPRNRTSIRALAELVVHETDCGARIEFVNPRELYGSRFEDAPDKFPEAGRLADLGWDPRYTLAQTVQDVVAWFQTMPPGEIRRIAGL
jgi:UDP-glucose 4-epimerase